MALTPTCERASATPEMLGNEFRSWSWKASNSNSVINVPYFRDNGDAGHASNGSPWELFPMPSHDLCFPMSFFRIVYCVITGNLAAHLAVVPRTLASFHMGFRMR